MSDLINEFVLWEPLKITTVVMFIIVIVLLPFSGFWSVIMLFAIVCLWSRVPCLLSTFTKDFEVVDFFVVMLAIHVGGIFGGIFGILLMLFSRIFGPQEWWLYTVKDGISIMVCGFLTPLFYFVTGGSAINTIYLFTIVRYALYILLTVFLEPDYLGLELSLCAIGALEAYLFNTFIMNTFEEHLSKLFIGGVHFSFGLFAITLGLIVLFFSIGRLARKLENYLAPEEKPQDEFHGLIF